MLFTTDMDYQLLKKAKIMPFVQSGGKLIKENLLTASNAVAEYNGLCENDLHGKKFK